MNSESVHLIATDPPFNKKRDFHTTSDSLASGASSQDWWSWDDDVHDEWLDRIAEDFQKVVNVVRGNRNSYGDDMGAFLYFMAVRLVEMKRILREDGSIYLHCDPTASHYLKMLMDAIFGRKNFRNEIIWCYPPKGNPPKLGFHRKHDTLLFYGKSDNIGIFNHQYTSLDDDQIRKFSKTDEHGRKYKEFKGRQNYLDESRGRPVPTWWDDIGQTGQSRTEFIGYPTQKPLKLYERIIKASSNEGDIVLDPFAGSATTCIAAEKLDRQWVGIDIWNETLVVVLCRLENEGLNIPKHIRQKKALEQGLLFAVDMHFTSELPERTDDGEKAVPYLTAIFRVDEPIGRKLCRAEMVDYLLDRHGSICQGCNREFDDPRYLELDHIRPRSDGGVDHISNRILLCRPCNILKSNIYTLSGLRKANKDKKHMANQQEKQLGYKNSSEQ